MMGLKVRESLSLAIYDKALRMSNSAKQNATTGDIVNYMQVTNKPRVSLGFHVHTSVVLAMFTPACLNKHYLATTSQSCPTYLHFPTRPCSPTTPFERLISAPTLGVFDF